MPPLVPSAALYAASHPFTALPVDAVAPLPGVETLLALFDCVPLVALGESPALVQEWDFIAALVRHPDFAGTVDVIVVDFGSAQHQPLIDAYLSGAEVAAADLRLVWRDVVNTAPGALDAPVYAAFFESIRAINLLVPPAERLRVILAGPPVGWQAVRGGNGLLSLLWAQNAYAADVVMREVLAQGRRALLIADSARLGRGTAASGSLAPGHIRRLAVPAPTIVQEIERSYAGSIFLIEPHTGYIDDRCNAEVEARLAGWPLESFAYLDGTWLDLADAGQRPHRRGRRPDGYLYLGPRDRLAWALPDTTTYDDAYAAELNRRCALVNVALRAERAAHRRDRPPERRVRV